MLTALTTHLHFTDCTFKWETHLTHFFLSLSVSHFYIGQGQVGNIKLSIFRYCQHTPFLASASTGLYKRMRWNVERKKGTEAGGEEQNGNWTEVTQGMEEGQEAKRERTMEGDSTE